MKLKKYYYRMKEEKKCVNCGKKATEDIHCSKCRNHTNERNRKYHKTHPWRLAATRRLCRYGMTLKRYVDLLFDQFGKCAICLKFFLKVPQVDHSHKTGKARGLLCSRCNRGLVFIEDKKFRKAADGYIRWYKEKQ